MTKQEFLDKYNLTEGQFVGTEMIEGDLDLSSLNKIPKGFNPTVGCSLYLSSLEVIPEGFNPTVGGRLNLNSVMEIPEGFNPTVGGKLYLNSVKKLAPGFDPTVGGALCLYGLDHIPPGFNPTCGGTLFIFPSGGIPDGFNPVAGGVAPRAIPYTNHGGHFIKNGFIFCDGILSKLISTKGNVHKVKHLVRDEVSYIIQSDGKFAHGATIKEATESLMFKISDRDKSRFENLKLDSKLKIADMIECYRVITGACEAGVRHFLSTFTPKKSYSIKEVIELTEGHFGHHDFKQFFVTSH